MMGGRLWTIGKCCMLDHQFNDGYAARRSSLMLRFLKFLAEDAVLMPEDSRMQHEVLRAIRHSRLIQRNSNDASSNDTMRRYYDCSRFLRCREFAKPQ
jgi:hypothetical protein